MRSPWRTFLAAGALALAALTSACMPPAHDPLLPKPNGKEWHITVPADQTVSIEETSKAPRLARCKILFGGALTEAGQGLVDDKPMLRVRYTLPSVDNVSLPRPAASDSKSGGDSLPKIKVLQPPFFNGKGKAMNRGSQVKAKGELCPSDVTFLLTKEELGTLADRGAEMRLTYYGDQQAVARLLNDKGQLLTKPTGDGDKAPDGQVEVMNLIPVKDSSPTNPGTYGLWSRCDTRPGARMVEVGQVRGRPLYSYIQSNKPGKQCPSGTLFLVPDPQQSIPDLTYIF